MSSVLLSTAYLPNVYYLSQIINNETVFIEKYEYFVKQTYRNRCDILSSTGALRLSIPLIHQSDKEIICEKKISYSEKWQHQHWRTITTAYKNSPYFEYFEDEFKYFYDHQFEFLFDYNTQLLRTILNILRVKKNISFTAEYELIPNNISDFRNVHEDIFKTSIGCPYYQVFSDKLGFTPRLSCLDALFNVGLETINLCE